MASVVYCTDISMHERVSWSPVVSQIIVLMGGDQDNPLASQQQAAKQAHDANARQPEHTDGLDEREKTLPSLVAANRTALL